MSVRLPLNTERQTAAALQVQRLNSILGGVPCANESVWPSSTWTTPNAVFSGNTRKRYITNRSTPYIKAVFATPQLTGLVQPLAVRAGIEFPSGVKRRFTFSGKITGMADGNFYMSSDFIPVPVGAGLPLFVTSNTNGPNTPFNGSQITPTVTANGEGCDAAFNTGRADKSMVGTITANAVSWYGPFALIGDDAPGIICVGLAGDSIDAGLGDTIANDAGFGFGRRAMNNTIPFVNVAISGIQATGYPVGQLPIQLQMLNGCSHIVDEIGINDVILGGRTAVQLQTDLINAAILMAAQAPGVQIFRTTLLPATTSSNGFIDAAGQTVTASEGARMTFNIWTRDGMPINSITLAPVATGTIGALRVGQLGHPYAGITDLEPIVSVLNGSSIVWNPAMVYTASLSSGISLHPSTPGHIALAAFLNGIVSKWKV